MNEQRLATHLATVPRSFASLFIKLLDECPKESQVKKQIEYLVRVLDESLSSEAKAPSSSEAAPEPGPAGVRPLRCSLCGEVGHNRVTCEARKAAAEAPPVQPLTPEERLEQRYPRLLARLSTDRGADLAREYGISPQRISQIRREFNIEGPLSPARALTEEQLELLGTEPDSQLALKFGVSGATIARWREERGIAVWSPISIYEEKLAPFRHLIGKLSDPQVAKRAGVKTRVVYEYRQRHGIETEVLSPRHAKFKPLDREKIKRLVLAGLNDEDVAQVIGSTKGVISQIRSQELKLAPAGKA